MVKVEWSSVFDQFQKVSADLAVAQDNFNAEVHLADKQEQKKRHEELLSRLDASPSSAPKSGSILSTVSLGRNVMFSGRDDVLSRLHNILGYSFTEYNNSSDCRRSCTIHGIGGMGKTETVLEYTYRYASCYSHLFWLHCESNARITQSFMTVLRQLNIYDEALDPDVCIEKGLQWFQSTGK